MLKNYLSRAQTKKKGTVAVVSFDIKKAFDTVPFQKLLDVLRDDFGIPTVILKWLSSYFTDRKLVVRVNKAFSDWHPVKAGVVQGSIIGPILFSAYINHLAQTTDRCTSVLYADDLLLMAEFNNDANRLSFQDAVDSVELRAAERSLTLNHGKCVAMSFTEGRSVYMPDQPLTVSGEIIPMMADGVQYLGVTFDQKLNWSTTTHVSISKAKRAVGCLRRTVGQFLTINQRKTLVFGKVAPIFTYCLLATYPALKGDRMALERLNRYLCRVVTNNFVLPYTDLLSRLDRPPIFQEIIERRILLNHKYVHHRRYQPPGLIRHFDENRAYNLRRHSKAVQIVPATSRHIADSVIETIAKSYNQLRQNLVEKSVYGLKQSITEVCDGERAGLFRDMQQAIRIL